MQIFEELNFNKGLSLAFGFFDGVHLGHQEVIKSAVNFAQGNNTKSAIVTFQDHPCCFFYDVQPQYIIRRHDKFNLFEKLGIDYVYNIKFDKNLSSMLASDYLKSVIINNFNPAAISTGFNHFFGAKKSGNVDLLKKKQEELQYKYFEIPPMLYHNEVISSTRIREDLALGNIQMVNAMLGYKYFLEEIVVEGQHIGEKIGFKTANLIYPKNLVIPAKGVYKVDVELDGNQYQGIANYGLRPTVSTGDAVFEVHLLNFDKDIYGKKLKVNFLKKIRDEKKFNSLDELKNQIKQDIESL